MRRFLLWLWRVLPLGDGMRFRLMCVLNMRFLVGVIGVVVDDDGRVLAQKHVYRSNYPWGIPSGWLQMGEQPHEAIVREIREEAGLRVRVVKVLDVRLDARFPRVDITYLCRPRAGSAVPRFCGVEVSEGGFYSFDQLRGRLNELQVELVSLALSEMRPPHGGNDLEGFS